MSKPEEQPEIFSNRWYYKQIRGQHHVLNRLAADYEGLWEEIRKLREKQKVYYEHLEHARAEIGELKEAIDKARVVFKELKNERAQSYE